MARNFRLFSITNVNDVDNWVFNFDQNYDDNNTKCLNIVFLIVVYLLFEKNMHHEDQTAFLFNMQRVKSLNFTLSFESRGMFSGFRSRELSSLMNSD